MWLPEPVFILYVVVLDHQENTRKGGAWSNLTRQKQDSSPIFVTCFTVSRYILRYPGKGSVVEAGCSFRKIVAIDIHNVLYCIHKPKCDIYFSTLNPVPARARGPAVSYIVLLG